MNAEEKFRMLVLEAEVKDLKEKMSKVTKKNKDLQRASQEQRDNAMSYHIQMKDKSGWYRTASFLTAEDRDAWLESFEFDNNSVPVRKEDSV